LRLRHAARDQPLLAGEGAVAGELVLDGLGLVELEVCRQAGVGLLGRVGVGAAMALAVQVGIILEDGREKIEDVGVDDLGLGLGLGLGVRVRARVRVRLRLRLRLRLRVRVRVRA